eukprot:1543022-Amphidinium_carterae.1
MRCTAIVKLKSDADIAYTIHHVICNHVCVLTLSVSMVPFSKGDNSIEPNGTQTPPSRQSPLGSDCPAVLTL